MDIRVNQALRGYEATRKVPSPEETQGPILNAASSFAETLAHSENCLLYTSPSPRDA